MAKPNYSFEKRQRERLKKQKKEEKLAQRKAGANKTEGAPEDETSNEAAAPATPKRRATSPHSEGRHRRGAWRPWAAGPQPRRARRDSKRAASTASSRLASSGQGAPLICDARVRAPSAAQVMPREARPVNT